MDSQINVGTYVLLKIIERKLAKYTEPNAYSFRIM